MAARDDERVMRSEQIAPGALPRVLDSLDMSIIFLAIVLFIVQASVIQPAGPAAYTYWILGFLLFLIPGAIITAQLGQMFPQEGSLYVWTQKALGPFWGFFAGFCAWWPGVLVMVATADLVVTIWQFIRPGDLSKSWQQMIVILALLGIEVPLNFGVQITDLRAIKKYLLWGSLAVMAAYLWATFGNMVTVPLKDNNSTTGILSAVQHGFWGSHAFAVIVALVVMWFFVSNTVVYNYSFSRLLFVSGLERRLPAALGKVDARKVPRNAVLAQTVIASIFAVVTFGPWAQNGNFPAQVYLVFQAAVTVIWCLSMVLLFADVFLVRRAFPQKFEEVRVASTPVLFLCGVIGIAASIVGAVVTFKDPWNSAIFTVSGWRTWLAIVGGISVLAAVAIYAVSEYLHKREAPTPTTSPA